MDLGRPPEKGPAFEAMMVELDADLAERGVDIPRRPTVAVSDISKKYNISIPLGGNPERMPPEIRENAPLAEAIEQWFERNYGDRLKMDPCPGKIVVLLGGDLYILKVPRIYGTVEFVLTREWLNTPPFGRGPAICNQVQLIEDMTAAKATRLTDAALEAIGKAFAIALPAAYALENTKHELIQIARGDVEVAINNLMARDGRFGESKWASLQAAEKVLKAAIDLSGAQYKRTHSLADLCQTLLDDGLIFDARTQIAAIQCKPGIRYGEEPCNREEALFAHHASLELVNILRAAGAKFEVGLD
jgi:hypothetical protein